MFTGGFLIEFPAITIVIHRKYGKPDWKKLDLRLKNGGITFRQKRCIPWNGDTFSVFHPGSVNLSLAVGYWYHRLGIYSSPAGLWVVIMIGHLEAKRERIHFI